MESAQEPVDQWRVRRLRAAVERRAPLDAAILLQNESDELIKAVLAELRPNQALQVLDRLPEERQAGIAADLTESVEAQWELNHRYGEHTVGRLMEPPHAVFYRQDKVADVVACLRELIKQELFTYVYVNDDSECLRGLVVMRDLLLADDEQTLAEIMVSDPFALRPETEVLDAMQEVVNRHYPVYPVCDENGRLIGLVPGYLLFEAQTYEITAQTGRMVGVEKEERVTTPWLRCFGFRHPWLQLNLFTAFVAAAVVGIFESTIQQVVALAVFLPVLAGQSGNTGCQALAVTLRSLTLGEIHDGSSPRLLFGKEAALGLGNGLLVGLVAALGMLIYAGITGAGNAPMLAVVVLLAMAGSCAVSGLAGVLVPLTLKRLGADPATASSIFLTTATDVVSMGLFLGLATLLVL